MAGLSKALILLIHDQGTQLLSWQQRKLTIIQDYFNTAADQEAFTSQIRNYPDYRVLVVTDLIDENFRHDLIVHVSGADRDALIKRKLDFTFRNTRYRIGRVKGREPDGRKQDKLLLAAISKPEMLDGWINLLLEEKRAITSVTSLAWLLRDYLPVEKLNKEATLLIANVDAGNSLRQSFFQEGKLMFSRLTNLTAYEGQDLASEVHNETLQVRQYLERIQFVQYEAPLRIQVLTTLDDSQLPLAGFTTEPNRFEQLNVTDQISKLGISASDQPVKPVHYVLAKVLAAASPQNIYAPANVTRYQDLLRLGGIIGVAAGVVLLIGIGGNLPLALSVKDKWDQSANFVTRTTPLLRQYDELNDSFPDTDIPASEMALIVQAYERIQSQTLMPLDTMNMLSSALAATSGVQLTSVTWELVEAPFVPDPKIKNQKAPAPLSGVESGNEFAGAVLRQNTQLKVIVMGESYSANSYLQAQQQVEKLAATLAAFPDLSVFASRMPTDVRTDMALTTTVNDSEVRAPFTLELTQTIVKPAAAGQVAVQP